jgi:hypothetical protein
MCRRRIAACSRWRTAAVTERALHLLLPALRWPDARDPRAYEGLSVPTLERLLGRGERRPLDATSPEAWLAARHGYGVAPPFAALAALAAGIDPGHATWTAADPVHLRPQGAELFLTGGRHLGITPDEASACVAALDRFFADDGIRFRQLTPERWVATGAGALAAETAPPSLAHGRSVDALLPTGAGARLWTQRFNEAQMILHPLPINEAREARGRLAINSVWFWGAGVATPPPARPFAAVYADSLEARGLAKASGATAGMAPAHPSAGLAAARTGAVLCWIDDGIDDAAHGDIAAWQTALGRLDRDFLAPAEQALKAGEIDRLEVVVPAGRDGFTLMLTRGAMRRFWRRPRRLQASGA